MKLLFALIGAVIGSLLGNLPASVALAVLGGVAGWALNGRRDHVPSTASDLDATTLLRRVIALERELAMLRESMIGSPRATASVPATAPETATTPRPFEAPREPVRPVRATSRTPAQAAQATVAERRPMAVAAPAVPLRDRLPPFVARWIFGGNTIVKAGVLILFLGLAFLLRYTAERVTLPAEARFEVVAIVGIVLTALGWRLRDRRDAAGGVGYGLILQGAGIGLFYLTTLGAMRLDGLLSPMLGFAFMALVAVFGAVLAVLQDAPWLAFISIAEGFAAPVFVSTGSDAWAPLMSYMAILDAGILAIAWVKAWRPLNLVGAVATFALAGAWAHEHYTVADDAGVQAFLVLFFLLFTLTGVLFARRALASGDLPADDAPLADRAADALRRVGRVDSTLTFGVPLAAFSLQYLLVRDSVWGPAWAAAAFALFHIALGGLLMRRGAARYALLGEAHVIVGTIFGTLAIPLALQGVWTGATWAIEAAGMYWLGARQRRTYARAFALVVMLGAALRLLEGLSLDTRADVPFVAGSTLGIAMLAVALATLDAVRRRIPDAARASVDRIAASTVPFAVAFALAALAWMTCTPPWAAAVTAVIGWIGTALAGRLATPSLRVAGLLLHLGAGLAAFAVMLSAWSPLGANGDVGSMSWLPLVLTVTAMLIGDAWRTRPIDGARAWWQSAPMQWAIVAWAALWWWRTLPPLIWRALSTPASPDALAAWPHGLLIWLTATALLAAAIARWRDWVALGQGSLVALPAWILFALEAPAGEPPSAHLGWIAWPLALLAHPILMRLQARWRPALLTVTMHVVCGWLFVVLASQECARRVDAIAAPGSAWTMLAAIAVPTLVLFASSRAAWLRRWRSEALRDGWLVAGGGALALALLAWLWVGNATAGDDAPLPWLPLLNPLEIGQGLVLLTLFGWMRALPAAWRQRVPAATFPALAGATAFALATGLVLRACHHLGGVAWEADALFASMLAQAALSVTWALIGVASMVIGHQRRRRVLWGVGAALLGVVVAKLFLVELADRASLYRIVSFIVVGGLMLAVGYLAPIPPRRADDATPGGVLGASA